MYFWTIKYTKRQSEKKNSWTKRYYLEDIKLQRIIFKFLQINKRKKQGKRNELLTHRTESLKTNKNI